MKIAVCFPSGDEVKTHFMLSVLGMMGNNSVIPITTVANCNSSRVAFNRNNLVYQAKQSGATHMLFMDADMVFPNNALSRLVSYDLDIVGATASKRNDDGDAIGWTLDGSRLQIPSPLVKMKLLGMPFMLVNMKVFEKLRAPWFAEPPRFMMLGENQEDEGIMPEDEYFCQAALKAEFDIWCDIELSMHMGHRGSKTYYIAKPQPEAISSAA